jgi:hypothetical protein
VGRGTTAELELPKVDRKADCRATCLTPIPDKLTCCGLSGLLSLMVKLSVSAARALGVKTTVIAQEFPAATLVPQLLL